jgi:hypothetical protein
MAQIKHGEFIRLQQLRNIAMQNLLLWSLLPLNPGNWTGAKISDVNTIPAQRKL